MGVGRRTVALAAAAGMTALGMVASPVAAGRAVAAVRATVVARGAVPPVEDGTPPSPLACRYRNRDDVRSKIVTGDDRSHHTWPEARLDYLDAHRYTRGRGIVVAVVDSGVDGNHPQLRGAVQKGLDVTRATAVPGADTDCGAHGTMVAGIIAARPVAGVGLVGIAPEATVLPIRHMWGVNQYGNVTSGSAAALLRGMLAAVTSGAKIVNVSVSVSADSLTAAQRSEFARIARVAEANDVLVVVATGNRSDYEGKNPATYPAQLATTSPAVMAVAGVMDGNRLDDDAITGPFVSVAAPDREMPCLLDHGGIVPCNGTSFGAPFVSGLAALVRSRFPQLTAAQVRARIEATADRPSTDVPDPRVGFGVINPVAALTAALLPSSAPALPAASPPMPRPPSDEAVRRRTATVAAGSVALVALVLAGWATLRRGRRRGWRPGRVDLAPRP